MQGEHGAVHLSPAPLIRSCFTVTLDADSDGSLAGRLTAISGLSTVTCCSCLTGSPPGSWLGLALLLPEESIQSCTALGPRRPVLGSFHGHRGSCAVSRVEHSAGDHACPRSPGAQPGEQCRHKGRGRGRTHMDPGGSRAHLAWRFSAVGAFAPQGVFSHVWKVSCCHDGSGWSMSAVSCG